MIKLNCLVIEDEPLSRDIMVRYIGDTPLLSLAGTCNDAISATLFLGQTAVDLLFLDINLPVISGLRFLKTLNRPPMVIFTTAYPEYAVEGFENDAVDYLVKPFSFERFLRAVNKAVERQQFLQQGSGAASPDRETGFLILRMDKKVYKVNFSEIRYLEATGDYVKVHADKRSYIVHGTMLNMTEQLPPDRFIRVHKSFIIPLDRIDYLEGNRISVGGALIPVGLVYRENLMRRFQQ